MDALLIEVTEDPLGSQAAAVAAVDATQLVVEDVTDFPDEGGVIDILGVRYDYTTVVPDAPVLDAVGDLTGGGTLVLATPLTAQVDEYDPVLLVVGNAVASDAIAVIDFHAGDAGDTPDGGDTARIRLDYTQRLAFPVGIYDPAMPVIVADDLSAIVGAPGSRPTINGDLIDPSTLPEAIPTEAPEVSPTLVATGMPSSVLLRAENVDPTTLIEYHASTVDGFTPDATTLLATTRSLVYVATNLPDGTPFQPSTAYFFRSVATNVVGPAPASPQVEGALDPSAIEAVVAAQVVAGFVLAGQIQVGNITISPDDGIRIPLNNGGLIHLPADGSDALVEAALRTWDLTIDGGLVVNGQTNNINGDLNLSSGLTDPGSTPALVADRRELIRLAEGSAYLSGAIRGLAKSSDGTEWAYTRYDSTGGGTQQLVITNATGTVVRTRNLKTDDLYPISVCRHGTTYAVLGQRWNSGAARYEYRVQRYNESTLSLISGWWVTNSSGDHLAASGWDGGIAYDGATGNLVVMVPTNSGAMQFRVFTTSGAWQSSNTTPVVTGSFRGNGFVVSSADVGTKLYYVTLSGGDGGTKVAAYNPSGTAQPTHDFAPGHSTIGLWWDGTRFLTAMKWSNINAVVVYEHSTNLGGGRVEVAYTWYDSDASGTGTHETMPSPRSVMTVVPRRAFVKVQTPAPPDDGSVDAADSVRVYTTTATAGTLHLLQTRPGPAGVYDWLPESLYDAAGAVAPTVNSFTGGANPGRIASTDGGFAINGSSDGSVGTGTFRTSVWAGLAWAEMERTSSQSVPDGTDTTVTWSTVESSGITGSSGVWTVDQPGLYDVRAAISYVGNDVGRRECRIKYNGATIVVTRVTPMGPSLNTYLAASALIKCDVGDTIAIETWQNSGGALNIGTANNRLTIAQLTRV